MRPQFFISQINSFNNQQLIPEKFEIAERNLFFSNYKNTKYE